MEVTTSRKPAPFLRTFSKDLAFALGCHYTPRGKASLQEITGMDSIVLVVSRQKGGYLIEIFSDGEQVESLAFRTFTVSTRSGDLMKGLWTENQTVYDNLKQYLNVSRAECGVQTVGFDGAQRRRYVLGLGSSV